MRNGTAALALTLATVLASCESFRVRNTAYCVSDDDCTAPARCSLPKHACLDDGPVITAANPAAVGRQGGFDITLSGRNFDKVTEVLFDGLAGSNVRVLSSTELKVTVPRADGRCGLTPLTLKTSDERMTTNADVFRYRAVNVSLSALGVSSNGVSASAAAMAINRPPASNFDDLLIGYGNPDNKLSYNAIEGKSQIIRSNNFSGMASVALNKVVVSRSVSASQYDVLTGDLIDKMVVYSAMNQSYSSFTVPTEQPMVSRYVDYTVADLDRDGRKDLIIIPESTANTTLEIHRGNVNGAYDAVPLFKAAVNDEFARIAAADFDKDGVDEIILVSKTDSSVTVLTVDASGNLSQYYKGKVAAEQVSILVADMDLDGIPDIVAFGSSLQTSPAVSVLYAGGPLRFQRMDTSTILGTARHVVAGDLDCDGMPDLIVNDGNVTNFYANTGRNTEFGQAVALGAHTIKAMVLGRFSDDNQNDIALLQSPCPELAGSACVRLLVNASN